MCKEKKTYRTVVNGISALPPLGLFYEHDLTEIRGIGLIITSIVLYEMWLLIHALTSTVVQLHRQWIQGIDEW